MKNIVSIRKKQIEDVVKHFQKKEKPSGLILSFPESPATAKQNLLQVLYEVFAGMLLFVGVFYSIQSLLNIPCDQWLFPAIAGVVLLFCSFFREKKYLLHVCVILVTLFVLVILLTGSEEVAKGLTITANQVMETLGRNRNLVFTQYEIDLAGQEASYYANYFLSLFALLLSFLCAAVVRTGNKLFCAVLVAPVFAMQLAFRAEPDLFFVILSVLATLLIWCGGYMGESVLSMSGTKTKEMRLLVSVFLSIVFVVLFMGVYIMFPAEEYIKSEFASNLKDKILHEIDEKRYYIERTDSFTQGDFRYLTDLTLKDEPALEVTMDIPQSVYLRGYVGSVYTPKKWEGLDSERIYEDYDMFYWLFKGGYSGLNQLSLMETYGMEEDRPEQVSVAVRNVGGNSKFIYTPYELNSLPKTIAESENHHDETVLSTEWEGSRFYQYTSSQNILVRYPEIVRALETVQIEEPSRTEAFDNNELHYRRNVYENYLDIPEETRELLNDIVGVSIEDGKKHVDYDEAVAYIKDYLKKEITYSTELLDSGTSDDFLERFLVEEKTGYSVHYATAATMLFRYCGIPSRYVEGYLVTPDMVKGVETSQTITVDGTWAHAWTEIYEDGIGWIPIEVTPPYDGIMEQAELPKTSIKQENQENEEEGKSEEQEIAPPDTAIRMDAWDIQTILMWIATGLLLLILLFIIGSIIYLIWRRKKTIERRKSEFADENRTIAVRGMYRYILLMLQCQGVKKESASHYGYRVGITSAWSEELGEQFDEVLGIAQKAFFSNHDMSDEEWTKMNDYQKTMLTELVKDKKWYQKLRYRYWYCLY